MEMATVNGSTEEAGRRRSGRTIRQPKIFGEETQDTSILTNGAAKRKRPSNQRKSHDNVPNESPDSDSCEVEDDDDDDDESESEPDEEETREQRAALRKNAIAKPAAKRPKTVNGPSTTLAIRPAAVPGKAASKSTKQKARSRPSQISSAGLYAEVFGKGNSAEDAAAIWHEALLQDNVGGIRELVNFTLQCIGGDSKIENADIEDIDNVPTRLGDIIDEYATQNHVDYPLSSKLKQYTGFREVLAEFCSAVVHALHNSGMLYDEPAVYDNIHIWTATMSGAGYRAFRHTTTVISLSMSTALCQVAQQLQSNLATTKTQMEAEMKKKTTNKARLSSLQKDQKRDEARLQTIDSLLADAFDTVYVHRYRDVDEKIRVECVTALGNWIILYRKMFLEGQYLRYLGWVLSDPNAPTRLEVVKALKMLFKNRGNAAALRAFTEKFRARIIEMGARDTDTSVRVEAIELLDRLRNAEYLEPDDIDVIGQLIFDNEPRIRKAVAKFFVSNLEDLYQSIVSDYDQEAYSSALPTVEDEDDFMEPSQAWLKFKCLAQTLLLHDQNSSSQSKERAQEIYGAEEVESRFMLAAKSIFPYMPELTHWESLAGYLLFDHSSITAEENDEDVSLAVQGAFKLSAGEDMALLDVLCLAFKLSLQQILEAETDKKGKRTKAAKAEAQQKQEQAASNLTFIIPQLLNKFGSVPAAAASILRLEQLLNIDLIADIQAGEATYETIIENINKQFTSHNDRKVLTEASRAFQTARTYETSKEAADAKVAEIWNDSREALASLLRDKNTSARGTLDRNTLREITNIMGRLAQLAAVSDCTEPLESRMGGGAPGRSKRQSNARIGQEIFLQITMQLLNRGVYDEDTTEQFAELEDQLCVFVMTVLSFYFRWKVVALQRAIKARTTKSLSTTLLTQLALTRTTFVEALQPVIETRQPLDSVRVNATLTLLELFTLFATIRHIKPDKGDLDDETQSHLQNLITNVPIEVANLAMETHEKMEKRLARKTKKQIDTPLENKKRAQTKKRSSGGQDRNGNDGDGEDEDEDEDVNENEDIEKPPEDSEDETDGDNRKGSDDEDSDLNENSSDEEAQAAPGTLGREARKQAALIAEQSLCELTSKLVLAYIATVMIYFGSGRGRQTVKDRLQVNRTRLGKSYGQVIAYLDEKKVKKSKSRKSEEGVKAGGINRPVSQGGNEAQDGQLQAMGNNTSGSKPKGKKQTALSEPMVIEEDDIEDDRQDGPTGGAEAAEEGSADGAEEEEEEDLRETELNDDVEDEDEDGDGPDPGDDINNKSNDENDDNDDVDDVMGD